MNEILDLLITYWKPIVGLLFTVAGFVIALIKKKPINDISSVIYTYCLQGIKLAEAGTKKGKDKLNAAVFYVAEKLQQTYPTINSAEYLNYIAKVIEDILSTPQKKG